MSGITESEIKKAQEEFDSKMAFEAQVAAADIYFDSILSKLTPKQRVESAKLMMMRYDVTNPLLAVFDQADLGVDFETTHDHIGRNAWKTNFNGESGPYVLSIFGAIKAKLSFVKLLKDVSGMGLKESKDAADLTPGVFAWNLTYESAVNTRKWFEENYAGSFSMHATPGDELNIKIGIVK